MKSYNVAILGATGAVGQQMLQCLAEQDFPVNNLKLGSPPLEAPAKSRSSRAKTW